MTCSFKIATSVARNNSRVTRSTWIVLPDDHGFDARKASGFVPFRTLAAFRNGRKIDCQDPPLKKLAVACGNHPYEDGE